MELGFRASKPKAAVAWVGEKVGRLKLNGQIRGYSPLSRVLELEALAVGVRGKLALWESLLALPGIRERLSAFDLDDLVELSPSAERGDRGSPAPRDSRSVRPRRFCSGQLTVAAGGGWWAKPATRPSAPGRVRARAAQ